MSVEGDPLHASSHSYTTLCEFEASAMDSTFVHSDFNKSIYFKERQNSLSSDQVTSISVYSGLSIVCCNASCGSIGDLQSNQACQALNQGESKLIKQLCNCLLDAKHWCFVHNRVLVHYNPQMDAVNDFGFMSDALLYTPLFRPATCLEANNLCDWAGNVYC